MLNSYAQLEARDLLEERPKQEMRECRKAEAAGKAIASLDAIGGLNNRFAEPAEAVSDIAEHWAGQQMARVIEEARLAAKNQEEADFLRAMAAGKISPEAFLIGTFLGGNEK